MSQVIGNILPFLIIAVVFYFMMILPEKKRKQKYQGMLSELKVNDEIVTKGGVIGKIIHMEDKSITLETSSAKTKIKFDKSAISYKVKAD